VDRATGEEKACRRGSWLTFDAAAGGPLRRGEDAGGMGRGGGVRGSKAGRREKICGKNLRVAGTTAELCFLCGVHFRLSPPLSGGELG
jgi:hypothetical protein